METGEHLESTGCTPAAWKVLLNPVFASEQQQAPPVLGGLAGVRAYIDLFLFHGLYCIVCKLVIPGAPSGAQKYLATPTEVLCWFIWIYCQHIQFSHSVVSDSF